MLFLSVFFRLTFEVFNLQSQACGRYIYLFTHFLLDFKNNLESNFVFLNILVVWSKIQWFRRCKPNFEMCFSKISN